MLSNQYPDGMKGSERVLRNRDECDGVSDTSCNRHSQGITISLLSGQIVITDFGMNRGLDSVVMEFGLINLPAVYQPPYAHCGCPEASILFQGIHENHIGFIISQDSLNMKTQIL